MDPVQLSHHVLSPTRSRTSPPRQAPASHQRLKHRADARVHAIPTIYTTDEFDLFNDVSAARDDDSAGGGDEATVISSKKGQRCDAKLLTCPEGRKLFSFSQRQPAATSWRGCCGEEWREGAAAISAMDLKSRRSLRGEERRRGGRVRVRKTRWGTVARGSS
uniref:Uncharacterized protein n=1 Tax=Oryza punctata TaxID=4537 RepID=A0A0E0KS29_ORYPU